MHNTSSQVEIIRPWKDFDIRYALFDFDGTISLIREGWQDIMIPYFAQVLQEAAPEEDPQQILTCVRDFVDTLTGKQTIFQSFYMVKFFYQEVLESERRRRYEESSGIITWRYPGSRADDRLWEIC